MNYSPIAFFSVCEERKSSTKFGHSYRNLLSSFLLSGSNSLQKLVSSVETQHSVLLGVLTAALLERLS